MAHRKRLHVAVIVCMLTAGGLLTGSSGGAAVAGADTVAGEAKERGQTPRIRGNVGPSATISVRPRRVEAGHYRFVVKDQSSAHNWHIKGSGLNKKTGIDFVGTKRFTGHLTPGRYRVWCDAHPDSMRTRLRVT